LELSHGTDLVYKDEKGRIIPELLTAMLAIKEYANLTPAVQKKPDDNKQWFDL